MRSIVVRDREREDKILNVDIAGYWNDAAIYVSIKKLNVKRKPNEKSNVKITNKKKMCLQSKERD